ncbi:hypothetical protein IW261DRAFT_165031 [Armillaria novae-zelandiae]|uniref:Secreted protein n=1 Tax=Armillaria novae-zelandiae TaxID=153914 RepID=A0AA39P7R5_9AGAR|nr:hypothetical protein IW261DRAFT_165031 [Armillaria novae-zelandiae]
MALYQVVILLLSMPSLNAEDCYATAQNCCWAVSGKRDRKKTERADMQNLAILTCRKVAHFLLLAVFSTASFFFTYIAIHCNEINFIWVPVKEW